MTSVTINYRGIKELHSQRGKAAQFQIFFFQAKMLGSGMKKIHRMMSKSQLEGYMSMSSFPLISSTLCFLPSLPPSLGHVVLEGRYHGFYCTVYLLLRV